MKMKILLFLASLLMILGGFYFGFTTPAQAAVSADGSLVINHTGTVYLIKGTQKFAFPSIEVFYSHGYNFRQICPASLEDLALTDGSMMVYEDGALVKGLDSTVWIISNGQKRGFTSAQIFSGLGYSFANLVQDSGNILSRIPAGANIDSVTEAHPTGALVNDAGTVYQITSAGKLGIPSLDVFESYGFRFERVVPASAADRALMQTGVLARRVVPVCAGSTDNHTPSLPVINGPSSVQAGVSQTYTILATDPDLDPLIYTIVWGDGAADTRNLPSGQSFQISHAWASAGTYTITVRVLDDHDHTTQSTLQVAVGQTANRAPGAPIMTLSPGLTLPSQTPQQFNFLATDPDGDNLSYTIVWGDGSANTATFGPSGNPVGALHTYAAAGTYTITVTVSDGRGGTASATFSVTVSQTATALPSVSVTVSSVGQTTITLSSTFTSASTATAKFFEYGATASLGNTIQSQTGSTANSFTATLSNLTPDTLYYFRAGVTNSAGTGYSPIANARTISATQASTLQSKFLKDDPTAKAIVAGTLTNYSIQDGLGVDKNGVNGINTLTFAYRVAMAIKQLGYSQSRADRGGGKELTFIFNKYQRLNGFPVTNAINKDLLLKIDSQMLQVEQKDLQTASQFPLYGKLIDPPPVNDASREHVARLMAEGFKALPASLVVWTEQNFKDFAFYQLAGSLGPAPFDYNSSNYKFCPAIYYASLGDACAPYPGGTIIPVFYDDWYVIMGISFHEYAHFLDKNIFSPQQGTSRGIIDTTGFYGITFDISKERIGGSGWKFYPLRRGLSSRATEFVSSYATGWQINDTDEYFTAQEDFAESFNLYVSGGRIFRELARNNQYLQQKYDWLKQNVFGGVEYNTGRVENVAVLKANPVGNYGNMVFNVIDYLWINPDFVWDYQYPSFGIFSPSNGTLLGRIVKDDNGNATLDSGEKFIRDPSGVSCTNEYVLSGVKINYGASQSVSPTLCNPEPYYSVSLAPGTYLLQVAVPTGWEVVGPNPRTISITSNTENHQWFFVRPIPQTTNAPVATLAGNNLTNLTVNVGQTIVYTWSSINFGSATSFYTINSPDSCPDTYGTTGPHTWITGNNASGSKTAIVDACQADRTYTITYRVTSATGQTADAVMTVKVNPQTSTNRAPSTPVISGPTSVNVNINSLYSAVSTDPDGDDITYTFDWGDGTAKDSKTFGSGFAYSVYHTYTKAGIYTITVAAVDLKGKNSTVANTLQVKVSEPTTTFPSASLTGNGSTYLTVNIGDTINYAWSSTNAQSATSFYTTNSPDSCTATTSGSIGPFPWVANTLSGLTTDTVKSCQADRTYTITYRVTSATGQTADAFALIIKVNPVSAAPIVNLDVLGLGQSNQQTVNASFTSATSVTSKFFQYGTTQNLGTQVAGQTGSASNQFYAILTNLTPGTIYYYRAGAVNSSGTGYSPLGTFQTPSLANHAPAAPILSAGTTLNVSASTLQAYSFYATDLDNDVLSYSVNWGDGSAQTSLSANSGVTVNATHTWSAPGTYSLIVTVADGRGGTAQASFTVTVVSAATAAPTAILKGNNLSYVTANVGDTISYTWSSSNAQSATSFYTINSPDTCPDTYGLVGPHTWITGNTLSGTKTAIVATCQADRTYTITYRVTSATGQTADAFALIIKVNPLPNNSPSQPNIIAPSGTLYSNTNYAFSASAIDADNDQLTYTFNWGDSSVYATRTGVSGVSVSATHSWPGTGTYQMFVSVSDGKGGSASNYRLINISSAPSNPTAILTGNGSSYVTASVGQSINYAWSSTGGQSALSFYTISPLPDSCADTYGSIGPHNWVANTLSGSVSAQVPECQRGRTYTITYKVTSPTGQVVLAPALIVTVNY